MEAIDPISKPRHSKLFRMRNRPRKPVIHQGNILMPDISGFTEFVRRTDLATGNIITQRLLTAVMESNTLDLQISEVEGDALLLYKYGRKLTPDEILQQYEEMLLNFETEIALISEEMGIYLDLSLKLIAHYGKISEYSICNFQKLYGESIIEAHLLLKNSVESKTYVLLTTELLDPETVEAVENDRNTYSGSKKCEIYGDKKDLCYQVYDYENDCPRIKLYIPSLN